MNRNELKQIIRESIKDQLSSLKEKAASNKQHQAKAICDILQTEANALSKMMETAEKLFNETQYAELTTQRGTLESLRNTKLMKIETIKKKFGIVDKEPVKKKVANKKKAFPKKKVVDKSTGMKKVAKNEAATGKGSAASVKAAVKKANKK